MYHNKYYTTITITTNVSRYQHGITNIISKKMSATYPSLKQLTNNLVLLYMSTGII